MISALDITPGSQVLVKQDGSDHGDLFAVLNKHRNENDVRNELFPCARLTGGICNRIEWIPFSKMLGKVVIA